MIWLFLKLVAGHFIADITLQSAEMAKHKNYRNQSFTIPPGQRPNIVWPYVMTGHCATHAAAVYLITGSLLYATIEFFGHWVVDFMKCAGFTNCHQDQAIHIAFKASYVVAMFISPSV